MKAEILEKYPIPNNLKGRFLPEFFINNSLGQLLTM